MLINEIRDIVKALPSGGFISPDSRFANKFLDRVIDTARAFVIRDQYAKFKRIDPAWMQTYIPEYSAGYQDGNLCFVSYQVPPVIAFDGVQDGHGYIGGVKLNIAFRQCNDRGQFAMMKNDRVMNPTSGRFPIVLFEGNIMEIYSRVLITDPPQMSAVFSKPTEIPTFNPQYDDYPIEESLIRELTRVITAQDLIVITRSAIDRVKDGFDNSALPMKQ